METLATIPDGMLEWTAASLLAAAGVAGAAEPKPNILRITFSADPSRAKKQFLINQ